MTLMVSDGDSGGMVYATYRRRPDGSLRRVASVRLPLRPTREEAKLDLFAWLHEWAVTDQLASEEAAAYHEIRASLLARLRGGEATP